MIINLFISRLLDKNIIWKNGSIMIPLSILNTIKQELNMYKLHYKSTNKSYKKFMNKHKYQTRYAYFEYMIDTMFKKKICNYYYVNVMLIC